MPAKSEAQRKYLAANKGVKWMREHGYDNKGKLPARVKSVKKTKSRSRKKR